MRGQRGKEKEAKCDTRGRRETRRAPARVHGDRRGACTGASARVYSGVSVSHVGEARHPTSSSSFRKPLDWNQRLVARST